MGTKKNIVDTPLKLQIFIGPRVKALGMRDWDFLVYELKKLKDTWRGLQNYCKPKR